MIGSSVTTGGAALVVLLSIREAAAAITISTPATWRNDPPVIATPFPLASSQSTTLRQKIQENTARYNHSVGAAAASA
jgi:hypothetical protein